jgi:hypothetical protein
LVSFTDRPLYFRGKGPRYPLDRWLGGPQNRSGQRREEKNLLPLPGIEPPKSSPSLQRLSNQDVGKKKKKVVAYLNIGTHHYTRIFRIRFDFNALCSFKPISINSACFNANYLLVEREQRGRGSRVLCGWRSRKARGEGKNKSDLYSDFTLRQFLGTHCRINRGTTANSPPSKFA